MTDLLYIDNVIAEKEVLEIISCDYHPKTNESYNVIAFVCSAGRKDKRTGVINPGSGISDYVEKSYRKAMRKWLNDDI